MKRLLFIGNSHLAALKTAWDGTPRPGYDAEFFAAPQRTYLRMSLMSGNTFGLPAEGESQRQRKIAEATNGKAAVSLADRQIIVLVGGFSATDAVAELLADCDVAGLREAGAPSLLSQPLFASICAALAQNALPETGWHNRLDAKVVLIPRPATNETCLASTYPAFLPLQKLAANPTGALPGFVAFDTALAKLATAHGMTYLPQPTETRTAAGLTAQNFLAEGGGITAGEAHKRGDHAHMNAAYGAAVVETLLTWLDPSQPPT